MLYKQHKCTLCLITEHVRLSGRRYGRFQSMHDIETQQYLIMGKK